MSLSWPAAASPEREARPASPAGTQSTPQARAGEARARLNTNALMAAVVRIEAQAPAESAAAASLGRNRMGSGVVIGENVVLTIGYLILETDKVDIITPQGRRIPATTAAYDHQSGFGLVRTLLPLRIDPLEMGDSDSVSERSRVLTLGQGERELTELMILSRKPFVGNWEYLLDKPFYTFPPVNNWSGAALFGGDGKLIGIGSMVVEDAASERSGVPGNLYVPINIVKPALDELLEKGRRSGNAQPWLGLQTEMAYGNLIVTRTQSRSPAERAGLSRGAVIVGVGTRTVSDQADFYRQIVAAGPAGTRLTLRVLQQGTLRDIEVQSVDRADFIARSQRGRGI